MWPPPATREPGTGRVIRRSRPTSWRSAAPRCPFPGSSYSSESGWSGSTGGFSGLDSNWQFYEAQPSYQNAALAAAGLSYGVRTTPDVSFNADPSSGVAVYDSVGYSGQSGWFQLGGTSAAAPAWAGLIAIADQGLATGGKGPLSGTQAQSQLYALPSSDYHDVTTGYNGYSATTGYDLVTGLGSPKANLVIAGLLSANGVSATVTAPHVTAATVTTTATTSSNAKGSQLDQTASSTSGTGTVLGTPASFGATGASALTSSPTASSQSTGIMALQTTSAQAGTVQAQTATQHSVATTLVNQSPAPASLPGQSLLDGAGSISRRTSIEETARARRARRRFGRCPVEAARAGRGAGTAPGEAPTPPQEEAPTPERPRATGLPADSPPVVPEETGGRTPRPIRSTWHSRSSAPAMGASGLERPSSSPSEQEADARRAPRSEHLGARRRGDPGRRRLPAGAGAFRSDPEAMVVGPAAVNGHDRLSWWENRGKV